MLEELTDGVAVITGAGGGIGSAMCRRFVAEEMTVVAADIDLESARSEVGSVDVELVQVDVADPGSVHALADLVFDRHGHVDLLCNNAGVFQGGLAWERSTADWEWTLGVNLMGIVHAVAAFIPRMIEQGTDAHVVNTSSVAAFVSGPMSSPYVVSKAAALSLSECLAKDLALVGSSVGVSVLTPSAVDTGIARTAGVRPDRYGTDTTEGGAMVAQILGDMVAEGLDPDEVMDPVVAAIRSGEFLIPTRPSYEAQLQTRFQDLVARRLPSDIEVD